MHFTPNSLNFSCCAFPNVTLETKLINFKLPNIISLNIHNNNVTEITPLNKLKILDCSKNNIDMIDYFPLLEELICSTSKISEKYNVEEVTMLRDCTYCVAFIK